ncbi:uncharacterized protein LOC113365838 [Ctenocephalides felis]|uniref:uncharacterized protein LOC113365838 n=1 Tax=Ctenocephalides felis TaxID=7515 RepID=UPI000E6E593D|nr:uncharacterized protein LOC113365838 [Ctenocephalides felis]
MNNNITPTKNDYYNVPSSPVFNRVKVKKMINESPSLLNKKQKVLEDSACNKIQSEISTHEKNATNISNEISCDKLEQTHDNKQKKYMLYSEKSKKNNSRDKISIKKNILSYAKCLESLNKTERQSRMKAKQLLSQGLQTFSALENIEQTSQSKELTLSSSLTDSELITANDLLQDFETKAIDFSQWTGNTEFVHTSPKSCIFQEQTNNEKNNISKKNCFRSGSGKTIPISQNALEKSRKLFEDDEISAKDENSTKDRDKICPFVGFHTGSGKQIPISQNALTKCRKLFEDNEVADKEYENCTKEANRDKISSFVGFQSGSGKQIPISQNALAKSRKLFEDSEISDKEYENFTKEANGTKIVGFQSDSGQKIQISQNALEKSENSFRQ